MHKTDSVISWRLTHLHSICYARTRTNYPINLIIFNHICFFFNITSSTIFSTIFSLSSQQVGTWDNIVAYLLPSTLTWSNLMLLASILHPNMLTLRSGISSLSRSVRARLAQNNIVSDALRLCVVDGCGRESKQGKIR